MSLTVNLVPLKRKRKKNGEIPIYIRITENRKSRYKSTGISVLPKHWNEERNEIRGTHPRSEVLNDDLQRQLLKAENQKLKLKHEDKLDIDSLKNHIKEEKYNSLIRHAERYLNQMDQSKRYWEKKKFGVLLNNLKDFLGDKTVDIKKVDADFIESFQHYLLTKAGSSKDGKKKGNNANTVRRKLTSLKGMFNHFIKTKQIKHDPFLMVDKVKEKPVERTKLTLDQIKAIEEIDLKAGSSLWHTRNYFMYSFYNAGIRFGDICTLKWEYLKDGRLSFKMRKTGGIKNIRQLEPMMEILEHYKDGDTNNDDYIFPILGKEISDPIELQRTISSKNVMVNRDLDEIAKMAGIESNVSFHVSRHSFSQYALEKGLDIYQISKALGHKSLKTTEHYLKAFDEELLDEGMEKLF